MKLRSAICLIALTTATVLAGCGAGFTPVRGEDNNVFFPAVRVSYPLVDSSSVSPSSLVSFSSSFSLLTPI